MSDNDKNEIIESAEKAGKSENVQNAAANPQSSPASAAQPAAAQKIKRPAQSYDSHDKVFFPIIFITCILISWLAFFAELALGLTAVYLLFFIVSALYFGKVRNAITPYPILCGALSLAVSAVFTVSSDGDMRVISLLATAALYTVWMFSLWGNPCHDTGSYMTVIDVLRYIFGVTLGNLSQPFRAYRERADKNGGKSTKILTGIIISLPIVCAVVPLLVSSDAAFEGLFSTIWENMSSYIPRIVFALIIFPFFLSVLFAVRKGLDKKETKKNEDSLRLIDSTVVNTVLCVVSFVYIIYLFSQLGYFFNAFASLLPKDFSFAQYARRGFFELCAIAGINLAIVALSLILSKKREGRLSLITKALNAFLCVFTMVLIATAISKMCLYIESYGMTRLRILTSCFMLVLAAVFICVIIRIFAEKFPYMRVIVVVAAAVLLCVSVADIDTVVARYNVDAYLSGKLPSADMETLELLGSGSTKEMIKLIGCDDANINEQVCRILFDRAEVYFSFDYASNVFTTEKKTPLKDFNLAHSREREALRGVLSELAPYAK